MRMRMVGYLVALAWTPALVAGESVPLETKAAMDELWRRGRCVLSQIVVPAQRASRLPQSLGEGSLPHLSAVPAEVASGRLRLAPIAHGAETGEGEGGQSHGGG